MSKDSSEYLNSNFTSEVILSAANKENVNRLSKEYTVSLRAFLAPKNLLSAKITSEAKITFSCKQDELVTILNQSGMRRWNSYNKLYHMKLQEMIASSSKRAQ